MHPGAAIAAPAPTMSGANLHAESLLLSGRLPRDTFHPIVETRAAHLEGVAHQRDRVLGAVCLNDRVLHRDSLATVKLLFFGGNPAPAATARPHVAYAAPSPPLRARNCRDPGTPPHVAGLRAGPSTASISCRGSPDYEQPAALERPLSSRRRTASILNSLACCSRFSPMDHLLHGDTPRAYLGVRSRGEDHYDDGQAPRHDKKHVMMSVG
jgi:hypothetical protein